MRCSGVEVGAVMVVYRVSVRCLETVSGGGFYRKRKRLLRPSERIEIMDMDTNYPIRQSGRNTLLGRFSRFLCLSEQTARQHRHRPFRNTAVDCSYDLCGTQTGTPFDPSQHPIQALALLDPHRKPSSLLLPFSTSLLYALAYPSICEISRPAIYEREQEEAQPR